MEEQVPAHRPSQQFQVPPVVRVVMKKSWTDYVKPVLAVILVLIAIVTARNISKDIEITEEPETVLHDEHFNQIDMMPADTTKIGVLVLEGLIVNDSRSAAPSLPGDIVITPNMFRERVQELRDADDLDALLLIVNTPGGLVSSSDDLAHQVAALKKEIPVYVYSPDLLASGGYYMAVNANKIFAQGTATVGSIGVIYSIPNVQRLTHDKLGIDMEVYKGGIYKDINNPFRYRSPAEGRILKDLVRENYEGFVREVESGRGFTRRHALHLATGQVWSGNGAKDVGLIDGVLYLDELGSRLKQELKSEKEITFIELAEPVSLLDEILGLQASTKNLPDILSALQSIGGRVPAGMYYLYQN